MRGIPTRKAPAGRRAPSRTSVAPSMGTVGVRATVPIEDPDEKRPSVAEIVGAFLLESHWNHGLLAGDAAADVSSITPSSPRGCAVAATTHRRCRHIGLTQLVPREAMSRAVWSPGSACQSCASASSPMTAGRGWHHGVSTEPCTDRLRALPMCRELRTALRIPRRPAQGTSDRGRE